MFRESFRSALVIGVVALAGCYSLQPARVTALEPGNQIAFDVTDAGRVALGGSMGPEIGQVEGRLIQKDNGEYLLGVTSVSLLRGGTQTWAGEQVRLKPEYVGNVYERRFDTGRSLALAAVGVGAVAYIARQNLLGGGAAEQKDQIPDTAMTIRRRTRTVHIPLGSIALPRIPFVGRP
jgi:hypothetical protein